MKQFLIIQTAFIGDAILATGMVEKLAQHFPDAAIDMLVRKGNESLLQNNPHLREVLIWDKKSGKYKNLNLLLKKIRATHYDKVINLQRFGATGLLTGLSGAKEKIGFKKNPFSFLFTEKYPHEIGNGTHEIERNHVLISSFTDNVAAKPKLYPSATDKEKIEASLKKPFICLAPTSVWFTKQLPAAKWVYLIRELAPQFQIYLLGAPGDSEACEQIIKDSKVTQGVTNLAGKLSMLQSAALMQQAHMNYTNDSAPMHMASSMNAPTTAVFCSTVPKFGFGPLADVSYVVQTREHLDCRPCGLHGYKACPLKHYQCANTISISELADTSLN